MPSQVEGELLVQPFYERGPVLIEEGYEADRALLRVATGEGQRAGANELAPQRLVAALGRLDDLAVQRLRSCCMRASVDRAAPSSVGSRAGIASTRRVICCSIVCDATVNDSSTTGGICARSSSFNAASSCACSASSGSLYLVIKRTAAESS